ncbi:MAG: hypothetical protein WC328_11740 [Kiritimatiellia bacterium]
MKYCPILLYFEKPEGWTLGNRTGWIYWRSCTDHKEAVKVARSALERGVIKGTKYYKLVDKQTGEEVVRSADTLKEVAV